jgi:hypothetical protein
MPPRHSSIVVGLPRLTHLVVLWYIHIYILFSYSDLVFRDERLVKAIGGIDPNLKAFRF